MSNVPFLGRGWSFPPEFSVVQRQVLMTEDEADIHASLKILFGTARGERLFNPNYGLDMHELLFDPMSTTLRTLLEERITVAVLIYEPRIKVLSLRVESPDPHDGRLRIELEYEVKSTNSRYNLVFPFYLTDSNELSGPRVVPERTF